jgi:hypothetical protein
MTICDGGGGRDGRLALSFGTSSAARSRKPAVPPAYGRRTAAAALAAAVLLLLLLPASAGASLLRLVRRTLNFRLSSTVP